MPKKTDKNKRVLIHEGSIKKNVNPPPTTPRPAAPKGQTAVTKKPYVRKVKDLPVKSDKVSVKSVTEAVSSLQPRKKNGQFVKSSTADNKPRKKNTAATEVTTMGHYVPLHSSPIEKSELVKLRDTISKVGKKALEKKTEDTAVEQELDLTPYATDETPTVQHIKEHLKNVDIIFITALVSVIFSVVNLAITYSLLDLVLVVTTIITMLLLLITSEDLNEKLQLKLHE